MRTAVQLVVRSLADARTRELFLLAPLEGDSDAECDEDGATEVVE
jgi:hypothetical protein